MTPGVPTPSEDATDSSQTRRHWDQLASEQQRRNFDLRSWGGITQVQQNHNFLTTGDPNRYWIDDFIDKYFTDRDAGDTLALGCGEGEIERLLFRRGLRYRSITGYDISEVCVTRARQEAERESLADRIHYEVRDLNRTPIDAEGYDFVFFFHSLHHVENVSGLLDRVAAAMRPNAVLLVNEFVGPTRFQWTDLQLAASNKLLHLLPPDLRFDLDTRTTKQAVSRRSLDEMISIDPSEAANSSVIDAELKKRFSIAEERDWGGTLNYLLFENIAGNFSVDNAYHNCIAGLLVLYENELISSGKLPSDFKHYVAYKLAKRRDAPVGRREKILHGLEVQHLVGIEIGPLSRPIVTKDDGHVIYVDHTDTAGLRSKYASETSVDVARIAEVDAVWGEQTLRQALGSDIRAHYVVASHVIEHVPDLIGWLREVYSVLGPQGEVRLAIPDRRFTFDYLRRESTLADALDAHLLGARIPLPRAILDHHLNFREIDNVEAWKATPQLCHQPTVGAFQSAMTAARDAIAGAYCDTHCWVFTPHSFARLFECCANFDLIDFACHDFYDTERNEIEFFVHLRKCDNRSRMVESWRRMAEVTRGDAPGGPESVQTDLTAMSAEIADGFCRTKQLRAKLQQAEAEIRALHSSSSWKLTRPLRLVAEMLRRLPRG